MELLDILKVISKHLQPKEDRTITIELKNNWILTLKENNCDDLEFLLEEYDNEGDVIISNSGQLFELALYLNDIHGVNTSRLEEIQYVATVYGRIAERIEDRDELDSKACHDHMAGVESRLEAKREEVA